MKKRAEECLCRAWVASNTDLLHYDPTLEHTLSHSYDIFNVPFNVHHKMNTDTLICIFVYSVCILSASCHFKYHHVTVTNADIMFVYCKRNFNCSLNYCIYTSFFRTCFLSILCIVLQSCAMPHLFTNTLFSPVPRLHIIFLKISLFQSIIHPGLVQYIYNCRQLAIYVCIHAERPL